MLHQIGSGVLGPVFRTYDPQADTLVAVKVFRLDLLPEDVARLADGLRRLTGAPGFVAAGLENTSAYLATDYLAGETLDVALRHLAPAPIETALPILERAAALIDKAWSGLPSGALAKEGAVYGHGALHPRDIFVTPDSHEVAITGFGVVPALEALGAKPPVRRPYTAPERAAGDAWDIRADIYSLAAIAHELLTGRRPAGPSEQDGSLLPTMPPETRAHIRRVLSKALAESADQRFATAAEFVAALGDLSAMSAAPPIGASSFAKAPEDRMADKPAPTPAPPAAKPEPEPVELTLLPVVDKQHEEFDLSHVIRPDSMTEATAMAEKPAVSPKPAVNRGAKSRTVAMPVAKPQERPSAAPTPAFAEASTFAPTGASADRSAGKPPAIQAEPRFRIEPELVRTPAPDFAMPPPTPWVPMAAVAIACLILGAAIDHQWMLSTAAPAGAAVGKPAVTPAPESTKTPPATKESGRADTEVAVNDAPKAAAAEPSASAKAPVGKPAVAPLPGRITIRSVPAGATVTIDGKPAGRTPLTASDLSLAGHSLVIAHAGFASETRRVPLSRRAPAATIAVTLKAERRASAPAAPAVTTGSVSIDSRPRGARITIDGRALGQSPASVPGLTPGQHALRLELTGYKPLVTTFTVKAGETARVAVTLEIR